MASAAKRKSRPGLRAVQGGKAPSIEVEAIGRDGQRRKHKLHARIVGEKAYEKLRIQKQENTQDDEIDPGVPASRAQEDEFQRLLRGRSGFLLLPPFDLTKLAGMREISTDLGESIDAMVTNTVSFGFQLKESKVAKLAAEQRERLQPEIIRERAMLDARLSSVHPKFSLTDLLERTKQDKYSTGNGYLELIENQRGDLTGLDHVHGHSIRMTHRDRRPTRVQIPTVRPDQSFQIEDKPAFQRFRRFVQIRSRTNRPHTSTGHSTLVWFKEAGDPRQMDWRTGEFAKRGEEIPFRHRATSLLHFEVYNALSAYGVPSWVGGTFAVFGNREADEVNWTTIKNNDIPAMFVVVENGALTAESIERLEEWVEHQIAGSKNYSKFIILEGETVDEGSPNPLQFRIKIEPLKKLQQDDQLFQEYKKANSEEIRQSFRLPPIFVGRSQEYNRATADTSRDIADEQVFAPERRRDDHLINRFILARWNTRFHRLVHNHPNITDDIELVRMAAVGERSGAMTPRRMDRVMADIFGDDLGPMPKGIDLDVPYSLQFAEAQAGGSAGGGMGGDGTASRLVENLLDLRSKIEKELDSRFFLESDGGEQI